MMEAKEKQEMVKVVNLEKSYEISARGGEKTVYPVLKGLSFQVAAGELVGIMGRSGCGKTTLLKVLGMIDKPDRGEIYYNGSSTAAIYGKRLAEIRRREVAFVFQDFYLLDSLTVAENIMLPQILDEADMKEANNTMEMLAKQFEIGHLLKKKPYELSGGEKQRVTLCRALIADPQLILADEPTGNLDSNSSEAVIEWLVRINQELGKTILVVTHDPIIASYCKRVLFLKDGRLLEDLSGTEDKEGFYQEILKRMAGL